jgi:hypothetical protein
MMPPAAASCCCWCWLLLCVLGALLDVPVVRLSPCARMRCGGHGIASALLWACEHPFLAALAGAHDRHTRTPPPRALGTAVRTAARGDPPPRVPPATRWRGSRSRCRCTRRRPPWCPPQGLTTTRPPRSGRRSVWSEVQVGWGCPGIGVRVCWQHSLAALDLLA